MSANRLIAPASSPPFALPVTHDLRLVTLSSLLIAALTAVAALAGLLAPQSVYPTTAALDAFLANDAVTLFLGLPILLLSLWQARRGSLLGVLVWPGALLYGLYNYVAYLFGAPQTAVYPLYLLIVTLSLYTLIALVAIIDAPAIREQLHGRVSAKLSAGVLIGLGALFAVRALGVLLAGLLNQTPLPAPELGLTVADTLLAAAWLLGGLLLWRQTPLGYVSGAGLLFSGSMLFIGLIAVLALQPLFSAAPLPLVDIVVVLLLGLIVFIPCGLFMRGVRRTS